MKRSEMVSEIAQMIEMIRREDSINQSSVGDINHAEEYASFLLHRLEALGMYPPDTIKESHCVSEWDREDV